MKDLAIISKLSTAGKESQSRPRQNQTRLPGRTHGLHPCHGDAVTKLLIEKGIITEAEFAQKLPEERAVYQRILKPVAQ